MTNIEDLDKVAAKLQRIAKNLSIGIRLPMFVSPLEAEAGALVAESKDLINHSLSATNDYSHQIETAWIAGSNGGTISPSSECISKIVFLVQAATRAIERKERTKPLEIGLGAVRPSYVDLTRIEELRRAKQNNFDLSKLIQLCCELNIVNEHACHHAVAMLVRTIMDHVPPILGHKTFNEVASNYGGGGASFKKSMEHLQKSLRNIADGHLHTPIRSKESLPTASQVDFRAALDQLLGEVIRTC